MSPFRYDATNYTVERSLGFLLNRLAAHINDELEATLESEIGVTLAQWRALAMVKYNDATTAAEICLELRHDSGAMTRMVEKLVTQELVAREQNADDRRAYRLRLTRAGKRVADQGFEIARQNLNRLTADVPVAQGEQLISLLQTMLRTAETTSTTASAPRRKGGG